MFIKPDLFSTLLFLLIVCWILGAILYGVLQSSPKKAVVKNRLIVTLLGTGAWLALCEVIVGSGGLEAQPMPRLPLFFLSMSLVGILLAISPIGKGMATRVPLRALILFQAFRLPLELVLHIWAKEGTIPETMTWTGQNFDILSGIAAIACAMLVDRWRPAAWIANAVGFGLLLNVMRVALMSSPLPFAWNIQPHLFLAFHSPYFLIGPVCVAGALAGHVVLTRALLRR